MNIVSFGGGTNSAALLIGLYKHKIPIDLITFADTGAEHPHTYQFIEIINQWLAEHGMPQITVVQYVDRYGNRLSLETECLRSHTLPSIAYGHKRCSQKHKIAPQEKFCNHYAPCREVWQRGEKVNRYIGYDAGEVKRYEHSRKYNEADKKYHNRYPLIEEWGWNRDDCIREIKAAGLPQPGDLVFFTGTYDTPGVSHVGIYVGEDGDGSPVMLHCGDPIQYSKLDTSYWQSHFYAYGRLNYN